MMILKGSIFLFFLVFSLLSFLVYLRTKIKSHFIIALGGILICIGCILWFITNNVWIFFIVAGLGGIIGEIGLVWTSFTEYATHTFTLERLMKNIPINNREYRPIKKQIPIIVGILMILIGVILGIFAFYIFHSPGFLISSILIGICNSEITIKN